MQINFKDLLKEQAIFIIMPLLLFIILIIGTITFGVQSITNTTTLAEKSKEYDNLVQQKAELEIKVKNQKEEEESPEIKKIYTLEGMRFGNNASFAPLFDDMIAVAKGSGIRIRSVDYNYTPEEDPIFAAKAGGVNVCELTTTIVGTYSEIQTFLKTIISQKYLVNIAQVEIISWQRDRSVLIANLKLRYYTKT